MMIQSPDVTPRLKLDMPRRKTHGTETKDFVGDLPIQQAAFIAPGTQVCARHEVCPQSTSAGVWDASGKLVTRGASWARRRLYWERESRCCSAPRRVRRRRRSVWVRASRATAATC